ncbi:hypothetical protein R5R35_008720 [Gryllus longicercus]|uniref:Cyclin-J n=2 Tax=Gryllus longicercus TaxID=2509291 RepID=A0AAN9Z544_9ORTH
MSRQSSHYYAVTEYAKDAHLFMKRQEEKRFRSHFSAPQLEFREELLVKIIYVSTKLKLSERALHLAVYILDTYMDCHAINVKRLELVCFACLSIAAKYEENDEKTSKLTEFLLQFMEEQPQKGVFIRMEFMILKFMQWKFIPTAVHFADYYVQYAVSPDDLNHVLGSGEELLHGVRQYMKMFLRLALLDQRLMNEPHSLIAAACIGAAREKMSLYPVWPNQMVQISGYRNFQVCAYVQLLLVKREKLKQELDLARNISSPRQCNCHCCCCSCLTVSINVQPASSSYVPMAAPQAVPSFPLTFAARDKSHLSGFMNDQAGPMNI